MVFDVRPVLIKKRSSGPFFICCVVGGLFAVVLTVAPLFGAGLTRTPMGPDEDFDPRWQLDAQRFLDVQIISDKPKVRWKELPAISQKPAEYRDSEAYNMLWELFSVKNLKTWFVPERWLSFHQYLLSQTRFKELLHLSELLEFMDLWPEVDDPFLISYYECRDEIDALPLEQRRVLLRNFYEELALRLRDRSLFRRRWDVAIHQFLLWDDNVNQMPEGEPMVSRTSGMSTQTEGVLGYSTRDMPWGQTRFETGVLATRYPKTELKERDYESFYGRLEHLYVTEGQHLIGFNLDHRMDRLNLNGRKEVTHRSTTPGFSWVGAPLKFRQLSWADAFHPAAVVFMEQRDALGLQAKDERGRSRDVRAFHVTALAILRKKISYGNLYATFGLGHRRQSSDALDLDYHLNQVSLNLQLASAPWKGSMDLHFTERRQDSYQGLSRLDRRFDLRGTIERTLPWRGWSMQMRTGWTRQRSDLNLMPFDNLHISTGVTWAH